MVSRYTKDTLKDVMTVIGGGLLEIVVENIADVTMPQVSIIPGVQPYNVGDAMGALEATLLTAIGIAKDKKRVIQLGAGGFAVAVPNLFGKVIVNSLPPATTASASYFGNSSGTYNRYKPMGATPVTVMRYPRR